MAADDAGTDETAVLAAGGWFELIEVGWFRSKDPEGAVFVERDKV